MKNKGFTLIEIAIVLCILGLLTAIGIPNLTGYMQTTYSKLDLVTGTLIAEGMLQAMTEGYKIQPTYDTYIEIKEEGILLDKNQQSISFTHYISEIPIPKEKHYTHFAYQYTSTGALRIVKIHSDSSKVQVYPFIQ